MSSLVEEPEKKIPIHNTAWGNQTMKEKRKSNLKTIRRVPSIISAGLPVFLSTQEAFIMERKMTLKTMINEYSDSICCSESWNRETLPLSEYLNIPGFKIISNVRENSRGEKPLVMVRESKFFIKELCPENITVPVNVEVVWVILRPRCRRNRT